jgi:hypothetical protein
MPIAMCYRSLVLLAGALVAPSLYAQAADPVPRELVLALLGERRGSDRADLRVGALPDGLPPALVPPDARILGSHTFARQSTTVLAAPQPADSAMLRLESQLLAMGWAATPSPRVERGFVSEAPTRIPRLFCKEGGALTISTAPRSPSGSVITLHYAPFAGRGACEDAPGRRAILHDVPVPTLYPPPGTVTEGGGRVGGGGDGWDFRTRLRGRAAAPEVLRHYAEQLRRAGWVTADSALVSRAAIQTLRYERNGSGVEWHGALGVAVPADAAAIEVFLNLRRP